MLKKVVFSLFFGCIVTIFVAHYDLWMHHICARFMQTFLENEFHCNASCSLASINCVFPSVIINDITLYAYNRDDWTLKCKKCTIHFSWLTLFFKGYIEYFVVLDDVECATSIPDGIHVLEKEIVYLLERPSFLPSVVKSVIVNNAYFSVHSIATGLRASWNSNSVFLYDGIRTKTTFSLYNGQVSHDTVNYSNSGIADIAFTTWTKNNETKYSISGSGVFTLNDLKEEGVCYISGMLESGRGRFSIRNAYNSLSFDPLIITEDEYKATLRFPLSYISPYIVQNHSLKGDVQAAVRIARNDSNRIDSHITIQDGYIDNYHVCDAVKITGNVRDGVCNARLLLSRQAEECQGFGFWNYVTEQGYGEITNSTSLVSHKIPYWKIPIHNFLLRMRCNHSELIGIYSAQVINTITKMHHIAQGGFSTNKDHFSAHGLLDSITCTVEGKPFPFLLTQCLFKDEQMSNLFTYNHSTADNSFRGNISLPFIKSFIDHFFHYDIQGDAVFTFEGSQDADKTDIAIRLKEGVIRLTETYNFINECYSHIVYNHKKKYVMCNDTSLSLYQGVIQSPQITIYFTDDYKPSSIHVPILLDHCLFIVQKDLFALISGDITVSYTSSHGFSVEGAIIIDKSQLKKNLLSAKLQKQLFTISGPSLLKAHAPITCDILLQTASLARVTTPFLETKALVDLRINNTIQKPYITGTIRLCDGSLLFPYRPLLISQGILTFYEYQSYDPSISLIAHNKIKKHDISLQINGTLSHHHMMLDAKPTLPEEKIMSLLLVGSEDSSLHKIVPTLIMHNIKNLIFASNHSSFLEKYFVPLLRPFTISLLPRFDDQTGRGGLRGIFEINVNDRLKATIQKNFSLTEDTHVELEFSLSDAITFRGIRDERRDLAGEVEMRWKF